MVKIENIEEIHNILLGITEQFHKICEKNGIPYYLAYGSMLGAKRHQGFIPWDDDMDVSVEFKYYDKLVDALKRELPPRYNLLTRYDKKGAPGGFLKIEDTQTLLIEDYRKREECTGVFLDVFLLYPATGDISLFSRYRLIKCLRYIQMNRFYQAQKNNSIDKIVKCIFKCTFFWLKQHQIISAIERYIVPSKGDYFSAYITIYNERDIIPKIYYGKPTKTKFEDFELYGVEKPHDYLQFIYKDYMKLPPLEKRRVHLSEAYYL